MVWVLHDFLGYPSTFAVVEWGHDFYFFVLYFFPARVEASSKLLGVRLNTFECV